MNPDSTTSQRAASEGRRAALIKLLADEDPAIYQAVRNTILSCGLAASRWLRPSALSNDPVLRRRAREILRHFDLQAADIRFLAFCLNQGELLDLEEGLWLLAATEYPDINVAGYRALLDYYAAELQEQVDLGQSARRIVGAINRYLFGKLGFAGSTTNYYDPQNSYLNRVMDRRTGNPISLCLLYMLLARRLGLPVAGIGLPGHFICRYQSSSDEIYLDAFNGGQILKKADCIQYLIQGHYNLRRDLLAPLSARRILVRVCGNLHRIYLQQERTEESTRLQRYLVALSK